MDKLWEITFSKFSTVDNFVQFILITQCLKFYRVMYKVENMATQSFCFAFKQTLTEKEKRLYFNLRKNKNF